MDILIIHKKSTCSHPDRMLQVDFLFLPELEVELEVKKSGGSLHRPIPIMEIDS